MKSVGVFAVLAAASLAASASADVVQFTNHEGAFGWGFVQTINVPPFGHPYLDMTQGSSQSGDTPLGSSLVYEIRPFHTSTDWEERRFTGARGVANNLDIAGGEAVVIEHYATITPEILTLIPPRVFAPGEFVGADSTFVDPAVLEGSVRTLQGPRQNYQLVTSDDFYMGVRFSLEGQPHYGWVRIQRPAGTSLPSAYEWAYETTPGASLQIPTPCLADWNDDGAVNSVDFFDFLTVFLANDPAGDFNHDTIVNSADFFEFLTAFFTGC